MNAGELSIRWVAHCAAFLAISVVASLSGCGGPSPTSTASRAPEASPDQAVVAAPVEAAAALNLEGEPVRPLQPGDDRATVLLFARTDCPISNRYAPEVRRIFDEFAPQKVVFYLVYPDPDESPQQIRTHLKDYSYPLTALRDTEHQLTIASEATMTPEAVVYTADRQIAYRGRINNRFEDYDQVRPRATQNDLRDAVQAVLNGTPVVSKVTAAVGCPIPDLR